MSQNRFGWDQEKIANTDISRLINRSILTFMFSRVFFFSYKTVLAVIEILPNMMKYFEKKVWTYKC